MATAAMLYPGNGSALVDGDGDRTAGIKTDNPKSAVTID
jgi:hypothetical protein